MQLEANGSYSKECTEQERQDGVICEEQRIKLVNMALLIPSMQLLSPFFGKFIDTFGPRATAYSQEALGVLGIALLLVAVKTLTDPLLYVGFAAMSVSTWLGSLLCVQVGLYFKGHIISRVIFILNSVTVAGSITFLILWSIHKSLSGNKNSVAITLGGYLTMAIILYGISAYVWSVAKKTPDTGTEEVLPDSNSANFSVMSQDMLNSRHAIFGGSEAFASPAPETADGSTSLADNDGMDETDQPMSLEVMSAPTSLAEPEAETHAEEYIVVADRAPKEQLISVPFVCHCIFFGLHVGMINWNTATQKEFLEDLGDDESDYLYLTVFTLLSPVSILGSPVIDKIILLFGWNGALQSINILAVAYMSVKVASKSLDVQILGFLIFVFYRSYLFGISFSFVPILIHNTVVGRAAGIMAGCGGLASCLAIPLIRLALKSDGGFLVPNSALLCLIVPTTTAVCIVSNYLQKEEIAAKQTATEEPTTKN